MQVRFVHAPSPQQNCLACGRSLLLRDVLDISPGNHPSNEQPPQVVARVRCSHCGFENSTTVPLSDAKPWQLTSPLFRRLVSCAGASLHNQRDRTAAEAVAFRARYWSTLHQQLQESQPLKDTN
ncbi:MAG: hypothetical protein AAF750_10870 [Planctomycetota bacterium]